MVKAASSREPERRTGPAEGGVSREVAERGFSETTLDDIARRAGVSKGVTLYYFDSKDQLFHELFSWLIDSIHARMREAVAREEDPVGKVRALVALIFPSPSKNRAFFRAFVDFCGLAARHEPFREVNARFYAGCREIDGGHRGGGHAPRSLHRARPAGGRFDDAGDLRRSDDAVAVRERIRRRPSAPTGSAVRESS